MSIPMSGSIRREGWPVDTMLVEPETFEALEAAVGEATPMLTITAGADGWPALYRAWVKLPDGFRNFGKHATTADEAARNLLSKVAR